MAAVTVAPTADVLVEVVVVVQLVVIGSTVSTTKRRAKVQVVTGAAHQL
jgi:hypothetical protein